MLIVVEDDLLERVMGEIMELQNFVVDYKKMLRCVFEVSKVVLEENRRISIDIIGMDSHVDDIEGNN